MLKIIGMQSKMVLSFLLHRLLIDSRNKIQSMKYDCRYTRQNILSKGVDMIDRSHFGIEIVNLFSIIIKFVFQVDLLQSFASLKTLHMEEVLQWILFL